MFFPLVGIVSVFFVGWALVVGFREVSFALVFISTANLDITDQLHLHCFLSFSDDETGKLPG